MMVSTNNVAEAGAEPTHLTDEQIDQFVDRRSDADELRLVSDHLSNCSLCRDAILIRHETIASAGGERRQPTQSPVDLLAALTLPVQPNASDAHLEFETLRGLVENNLTSAEANSAQTHLDTCATCREDLRDLQRFRLQLEAEKASAVSALKPVARGRSRPFALAFGMGLAGACAAVLLLEIIVVQPLKMRVADTRQRLVDQQRLNALNSHGAAHNTIAIKPQRTSQPTSSTQIAQLNLELKHANARAAFAEDKARAVRQNAQQVLKGNRALQAQYQKEKTKLATLTASAEHGLLGNTSIERTLKTKQFNVLPSGKELAMNFATPANLTRGGDIALLSPVQTLTVSLHPTFTWAAPQADHFSVTVRDVSDAYDAATAKMGPIIASTDAAVGGITDSSWQCPTPLIRGHYYSWSIRPIRKGLRLNESFASFHIADKTTAARYADLQVRVAIADAQEGLFDAALSLLEAITTDVADLPEGMNAQRLADSLRQKRQAINASMAHPNIR